MNPRNDTALPAQYIPDGFDLGISLRVLVLVNATVLLHAWADGDGDLQLALMRWFAVSAWLQPTIISSLLTMGLLRKVLVAQSRGDAATPGGTVRLGLPGWAQKPLVVLIPAAWVLIWFVFVTPPRADGAAHWPWVQAVLAGVAAVVLLSWLDLRARAFSPAVSEARLALLQARIRPHFLFNALNAVLGVLRSDPERAEETLLDLADLIRAVGATPDRLTRLADELALTRGYLSIESLRLGERLQVKWLIDPGLDDVLVPPLLLQPLAENSVLHGIEPSPTPGLVEIEIRASGDRLKICVANSLPALPAADAQLSEPPGVGSRRGQGIALDNIRERLNLLYDVQAAMSVQALPQLYRVCVDMPVDRGSRAARSPRLQPVGEHPC